MNLTGPGRPTESRTIAIITSCGAIGEPSAIPPAPSAKALDPARPMQLAPNAANARLCRASTPASIRAHSNMAAIPVALSSAPGESGAGLSSDAAIRMVCAPGLGNGATATTFSEMHTPSATVLVNGVFLTL